MKNNIEKIRVEKMLEIDRVGLSCDAEELVKRDIEWLLEEYFCLKKRPKVILHAEGYTIGITIEAEAKGVKRFDMLK